MANQLRHRQGTPASTTTRQHPYGDPRADFSKSQQHQHLIRSDIGGLSANNLKRNKTTFMQSLKTAAANGRKFRNKVAQHRTINWSHHATGQFNRIHSDNLNPKIKNARRLRRTIDRIRKKFNIPGLCPFNIRNVRPRTSWKEREERRRSQRRHLHLLQQASTRQASIRRHDDTDSIPTIPTALDERQTTVRAHGHM
jgi:hypothetical protein